MMVLNAERKTLTPHVVLDHLYSVWDQTKIETKSPSVMLGNRGASLTTDPPLRFRRPRMRRQTARILNRNTAEAQPLQL